MKRDASALPPENIQPEKTPLFVAFGFDDNACSGSVKPNDAGGVEWVTNTFTNRKNPGINNKKTFDNMPCSASFYFTSGFIAGGKTSHEPTEQLKRAWHRAWINGIEAGNHTHLHNSGLKYSEETWLNEMETCNSWLMKPAPEEESPEGNEETGAGVSKESITGFRTPFLEFNTKTFNAAKKAGFEYDCSMEEGWQKDNDGTNYLWPYTLHNGSPGYEFCHPEDPIEPIEDMWEMPCYPVIIPPDELCEKYGVKPGLRASKVGIGPDDEPYYEEEGKITGLDWNMFVSFQMTKEEFLATMKYTFDLRLKGNRAPLLFGAHSDLYCPNYTYPPKTTPQERREAVEEFLDYVLSHEEARVVSVQQALEWIKKPVELEK